MSAPMSVSEFQEQVRRGIPAALPAQPPEDSAVSRAPARPLLLDAAEKKLALRNALRYFPAAWHARLGAGVRRRAGPLGPHLHAPLPARLPHARPAAGPVSGAHARRPRPSC